MVRVGLWGVHSRGAAWAFFWLSIAAAAGCIAYGFINPPFFAGGALLLAALWYYLSIRWVDGHGGWS
jgi:hypothetical protein